MSIAGRAAPQIDRLVLAVNGRAGASHGDRFATLAEGLGLDSPRMLDHFAEFLLAGRLEREIAIARMPYAPRGAVGDRLDELEARGLIVMTTHGLSATDRLRPLLDEIRRARASVARELWSGADADVSRVSELASAVIGAAGSTYPVARAHGALPAPDDPYLRLHQRLTTLRYVRSHAHATAWRRQDLSAEEVVAMTKLWTGVAAEGEAVAALVARGYASGEPPELTAEGVSVRESIEAETNRMSQAVFDVLDAADAAELLAVLERLPGTRV